MIQSAARAELLGLYLYPAGTTIVNAPYAQYLSEDECLTEGQSWWDVAASLTYWHEADHFEAFTCSPYLTHVGALAEAYASMCGETLRLVDDGGLWESVPLPLVRAHMEGALPPEAAARVSLANRYRLLLHGLVSTRGVPDRLAWRLTEATRMCARFKDLDVEGFTVTNVETTSHRLFPNDLSVMDLLEDSGRLTELGHLSTWGANEEQISFWAQSCLCGRYGRAIRPLWSLFDVDILHLAIQHCFRAPFFPYSEEDGGVRGSVPLSAIHPVMRFYAIVDHLLDNGLARASARQRRSSDALFAFHGTVRDELEGVFDVACDGGAFRRSTAALWHRFLEPAWADVRRERRLDSLLREYASLADVREARFASDARDRDKWIVRSPQMASFSVIFTDAEVSARGVTERRSPDDELRLGGHRRIAITQAVGEAALYGDLRLLATLLHVLGADASPMGVLKTVFEASRVPFPTPEIPAISWDDRALDEALRYADASQGASSDKRSDC